MQESGPCWVPATAVAFADGVDAGVPVGAALSSPIGEMDSVVGVDGMIFATAAAGEALAVGDDETFCPLIQPATARHATNATLRRIDRIAITLPDDCIYLVRE
jgi:hypothetical protein